MKDYTSGTALVAHSAGATSPVPHLGGADRHVFRLAAQTWLALQAIDVPPTPKNFELWFTYLGGKNAELTSRMDELLQHGHRPMAEILELIHAECIAARSSEMAYEGIAFYEDLTPQAGDTAAFRFFDTAHGTHLFTQNASERASILATRPDLVAEDIAFYAPT